MANEITIQSKITCSYLGSTVTNATSTDGIDIVTAVVDGNQHHTVQDVGTTREAASVGDVDTTESYHAWLRNMDSDNFVAVESYDATNYTDCGVMLPGETWGPVRMPASHTLHLKADTAACKVEVIMCESGITPP